MTEPTPSYDVARDIPAWALKLARRLAALPSTPFEIDRINIVIIRMPDGQRVAFINGHEKGEVLGG